MEPSVLEYARYYGVSMDHLGINPLALLPTADEAPLQLDDEPAWLQLGPTFPTPPPERLTAGKEASALLAVTDAKHYQGCEFDAIDVVPSHLVRNLKVELPLLRSDPEVDMLDFVHHIEPNLADEFIPFEKVDDEQDEGLEWPSYCHGWPARFHRQAQSEKLEVARDVIAYMKAVLESPSPERAPKWEYDWPSPSRNVLRQPITPPLLPRSPSPQPFEPSSETGRLELLSQRSSPTRQELNTLNQALIGKDALVPAKRDVDETNPSPDTPMQGIGNIGELYSPLRDIHRAPSPPRPKRRRISDLKVEAPLTPPQSHQPPPWEGKAGSVSGMLQPIIPEFQLPISNPEQTSADDIDKLFAEYIAPTAAKAEREVEQEQLQEADTTCRVPVPIVDFSKPKPPWDTPASGSTSEGHMKLLLETKENYLNLPQWRLDGHILRQLSWRPFPSSFGHYQLEETIEDDGSLASFLAEPEAMDLDTLIWKPPGLRFLDDVYDPDSEELEYGIFPPAKDVKSLIKKRVFELQSGEEECHVLGYGIGNVETVHAPVLTSGGMQPSKECPHQRVFQSGKLDRGRVNPEPEFSAMSALNEYLGLRTGNARKAQKVEEQRPKPMAPTTVNEPSKPHDSIHTNVAKEPTLTVPTPDLNIPTTEAFFVASTTFLSNRSLVRQVQSLYPSARIIERDFALYSPRTVYQVSRRGTPGASPESAMEEVDLALSPSTGLILTSIQKIKQQALPGQATRSPVRERIGRVAARYVRLIIIVSRASILSDNDISCSVDGLDESDCEALSSLTASLNQLPALEESEVVLVDGDASGLATWIVSFMLKYTSHSFIKLIEEETLWEVFLRQAGMNAFAAQAVLAEMKLIAENEGGAWGLREFCLMKAKERLQRFNGCVGGSALLERIGKGFDARW